MKLRLFDQPFFLEGTESGGRDIDLKLLTVIKFDSFLLDVWLENFASLPLREGHVVAVHLTFAG